MKAMLLEKIGPIGQGSAPLRYADVDEPKPGQGEVRLRVAACGVCHTELDEIEGRTAPPRLPVIPGHEVIGIIDELGPGVSAHKVGDRIGVGWIHHSSGGGDENVSACFRATGRDVNGGYAEYMTVPAAYAYPIPEVFTHAEAAPLLCAGGVGYRALKLSGIGDGGALGFTGFGGSAHLVFQVVRHLYPDTKIYVFARDQAARDFALGLGAEWAGATDDRAPELLDAIIDTTPAWKPIVAALLNLRPGGRLVINAIRKEDRDKDELLSIDYATHLWLEKEIKTVANVTARDLREFLPIAAAVPLRPLVETFPLAEANRALVDLKHHPVRGAKVLLMGRD